MSTSPETIKLTRLKPNKDNPRYIRDENWKRLMSTIEKYPHFLSKRPIIIDSWENPVILAGNMRYKALRALKRTEVPADWIKTAEDLTPDEKKAFTILDNTHGGEWQFDTLANDWDIPELESLGVFIPNLNGKDLDEEMIEENLSEPTPRETKEKLFIDEHNGLITITLMFTKDEAAIIETNAYKYGATKEEAFLKLIKKDLED